MKNFFIVLFVLIAATLMGGCRNLTSIYPISNVVPVIISEPIIIAIEDQLYSYQVEASDPNGDTLSYFLSLYPEGMSIISENGLISWRPTNDQVGISEVIIEISDGKCSVQQKFEIEVINVNNSPHILSYFPSSLNLGVNEGDSIKFGIQARDIDLNTVLSYQWLLNGKKVSSSTVSGNSSKSSWIYSASYGDYSRKIVKVFVSDGELQNQSYVQWNITINDIIPPVQPTLNPVTSPVNISPQILSGNKETNTSIWINEIESVLINSDTTWSYPFELSEGSNKISIIACDTAGNGSTTVTADITLDTIIPETPTLNPVTSPVNVSPQTLSGTKEENTSIWINDIEVVLLDLSTEWSYPYNLFEGNNNISITSRDTAGNESSAVTAIIEYDSNIYVDIGNTSGIEDGTKTHPFNSITEGIEAVSPGKSVMVVAGDYKEQLIINKGIILQGAGVQFEFEVGIVVENEFTLISGLDCAGGNLITITTDNVTISGFVIDGKGYTDIGIYSDSFSSIEISENLIQNHRDSGISYYRASDDYPSGIYVYNNEICYNSLNGIKVIGAGSGIIESNTIRKNTNGIRTSNSVSLEIKHNNINDNSSAGILCQDSSFLLIWGNEITINDYGIKVGVLSSDTTNPDIGGGTKDGVGQNKITGNKIHGVGNMTTHNIMAKNNWWGDAVGPKYPGNPKNASISSDWVYWSETVSEIIFIPYLTTEP